MLRNLRLLDFRCFASLDLEVPAQGGLFTGDNAQGKTSILEALCVLVRLQSPRTHKLGTLARMGTTGFGVAGNPWGRSCTLRQTRAGLELTADNQRCAGRGPYLDSGGLVVWMGNDDLDLVRGPGETRRRYLDFAGVQLDPEYRRAWSRYRRALKAKNLLLKDGRPRDAEIASYEEILASQGEIMIRVRRELVERLSPLAAAAQRAISGREEPLTLHYLPASGPNLLESIRQARNRENAARQTLVGPHRDQLDLRLHGLPAAEFASEGQQRTLALALKLAQGAVLADWGGRTPIYLMDDIFGELDPARRNALLRHLPAEAQKWITTTHLDWLRDAPEIEGLGRFEVAQGTVRPR